MQIGWFSTGRDKEARRLLEGTLKEIEQGLKINIAFVFCNREYGESPVTDELLNFVKSKEIKLLTLSSRNFKPELRKDSIELWREEYSRAVWKIISGYKVEFSFLAGYMLIVGRYLIERHKMLNLHPAIPGGPKGTWQEVIWKLIEEKAPVAGAQIHLVTPELDEGPPVTFCKFPIRGHGFDELWKDLDPNLLKQSKNIAKEEYPLFRKIREEEFKREIPLILVTLRKISEEGSLESILNKSTLVAKVTGQGGIDLSAEVNEYIQLRTCSL